MLTGNADGSVGMHILLYLDNKFTQFGNSLFYVLKIVFQFCCLLFFPIVIGDL